MRRTMLLGLLTSLVLAPSAHAGSVIYELATPGVV